MFTQYCGPEPLVCIEDTRSNWNVLDNKEAMSPKMPKLHDTHQLEMKRSHQKASPSLNLAYDTSPGGAATSPNKNKIITITQSTEKNQGSLAHPDSSQKPRYVGHFVAPNMNKIKPEFVDHDSSFEQEEQPPGEMPTSSTAGRGHFAAFQDAFDAPDLALKS